MGILYAGKTNIGMVRKSNQDSICVYPKRNLFVVADGMGGHSGGDIASQMAAKIFPEFIEGNLDADISDKDLLAKGVETINSQIFAHASENEKLKGMGTTISGLKINGSKLSIVNVGDSRTYLINNSQLFQMTRDNSLVQEKLNLGIYDRLGAKADPQKNVLIRAVGNESEVECDSYHYKIKQNDLFLICSDGLHGKVSDNDIMHILTTTLDSFNSLDQKNLDLAADRLIQQANDNGGQDNISVILVACI